MKLIPPLKLVVAIALTFAVQGVAHAFNKPPFPRLGAYLIGSPQNYDDPTYQSGIARLNMVILSVWPGMTFGGTTTMSQVLQNLKGRNPNLQTFLYMDINEAELTDPIYAPVLNNNNWWLYPAGSGGTPVKSTWGNTFYITNTSIFGTNYLDWRASYQAQQFYSPNPGVVDGFFTDNVFSQPRVDGDWNRDGVTDSRNDSQTISWFRQGYAYYFNRLRQLMPGKYQLGNVGFVPGQPQPEYEQVLNGGILEGLIGYSWSYDTFGGYEPMMGVYRETLAKSADPKFVLFHAEGAANDYRTFRYAFASCLMDDGYFYYAPQYVGIYWFDEYDFNLGYAVSSPPTATWQSGDYRRDFDNGIVLVNPKGNGARQVFLEADFVKINGTQDTSVNSGQTVRSVILQDRDGIVLRRVGASSSSSSNTATTSSTSSSSSSSSTLTTSAPTTTSTPTTTTSTNTTSSTSAPGVPVPKPPVAVAIK